METFVWLGVDDAGEVLTLQRAAYVTEARAHDDLDLPPLRQPLADLEAELADPQVLAAGWRNGTGRLLPPCEYAPQRATPPRRTSPDSPWFRTGKAQGSVPACSPRSRSTYRPG